MCFFIKKSGNLRQIFSQTIFKFPEVRRLYPALLPCRQNVRDSAFSLPRQITNLKQDACLPTHKHTSVRFILEEGDAKLGANLPSCSDASLFFCGCSFSLPPCMMFGQFSRARLLSTMAAVESPSLRVPSAATPMPPRVKFKRLDKTARNIMQILDREDVEEIKAAREIPEIKPGYIVQLKVEVPENKRRVSLVKGIVIARRNAGLNTTFRLRRLVAGVGIETVYPLYSPNIKEIKILEIKKVRRAKLYYLRNQMNALKK